jgi:hypothetical protein
MERSFKDKLRELSEEIHEANEYLEPILQSIKEAEDFLIQFDKNVWLNFEEITIFWDADIKKLSIVFDIIDNLGEIDERAGTISDFGISIMVSSSKYIPYFLEAIKLKNQEVIYE